MNYLSEIFGKCWSLLFNLKTVDIILPLKEENIK